MEFSKKLKNLRIEKGISQQKLADMLFVSRSTVAKWENGLGLPSEASYEALEEFFGIPKECFTTDETERIVIEKNKKTVCICKLCHRYRCGSHHHVWTVSSGILLRFGKLGQDRSSDIFGKRRSL